MTNPCLLVGFDSVRTTEQNARSDDSMWSVVLDGAEGRQNMIGVAMPSSTFFHFEQLGTAGLIIEDVDDLLR